MVNRKVRNICVFAASSCHVSMGNFPHNFLSSSRFDFHTIHININSPANTRAPVPGLRKEKRTKAKKKESFEWDLILTCRWTGWSELASDKKERKVIKVEERLIKDERRCVVEAIESSRESRAHRRPHFIQEMMHERVSEDLSTLFAQRRALKLERATSCMHLTQRESLWRGVDYTQFYREK